MKAGTYYLGISRAEETGNGEVPLSIFVDPPSQGNAHVLADNDTIRGGEGDDILVGRGGRDAIFGQSGIDTFVAERFEARDRTEDERIRNPETGDLLADQTNVNTARNPRVVVASSAPTGAVPIVDVSACRSNRRRSGSSACRFTIRHGRLCAEVRVSDLGSVTRLDASDADITIYNGLQYLVGLESLDLSGNGNLTNFALTRIAPANNNTSGMPHLRHLNVDDNVISSLANLQGLSELTVLSVADQQSVVFPLKNVPVVAGFNELVYLDLSGNSIEQLAPLSGLSQMRAVDLAGNPIETLGPMIGMYVRDDSPLRSEPAGSWIQTVDPSGDAIGGTHHALNTAGADLGAVAVWDFRQIPAGEYDVLVTWHADPSHSRDAVFEIHTSDFVTAKVNQQLDPAGQSINRKSFQSIGTITVGDNAVVRVELRKGNTAGLVIADAVALRLTEPSLPKLQRIDARDTRLDSTSRKLIASDLAGRPSRVQIDLSRNLDPRWSDAPTLLAIRSGSPIDLGELTDFVSDPDGPAPSLTARVNDERVAATLDGPKLTISAIDPVDVPVTAVLTATDADGLSSDHYIAVVVDAYLVEGTVRDSLGVAVEGALVYVDTNSDGGFSSGEPSAVTGSDGRYRLRIADRAASRISVQQQPNWETPPSVPISLPAQIDIVTGADLTITRAVDFELVPTSTEGTEIKATGVFAQTGGDILWEVTGGPVIIGSTDGDTFKFTPLDGGDYTVALTYKVNSETFTAIRVIPIANVSPIADAGGDVTITEGRFKSTRPLVVDPGADSWTALVQYGDGAEVKFVSITEREVTLDHIYSEAGTYTVNITVSNTEGVSTDSFEVVVNQGAPVLDLIIETIDGSPIRQGAAVPAYWEAVDASFVANRFTWSYWMDWGDGTPLEDISDSLQLIIRENDIQVIGEPTHVYQDEGPITARLIVMDDHGVTYERPYVFQVQNDLPLAEVLGPETVAESVLAEFSVNVIDLDGVGSIEWDFGDGSDVVVGTETTITHSYADPGEYKIIVTVDDGDGGSTSSSLIVNVTNVPEPPSLAPIPRLRVAENQTLVYSVQATDPDAEADFEFTAPGAPVGFSITSGSGTIIWTPTLQQGPATYNFNIVVTDETGLQAETPISIEVTDTGSISGQVFRDADVNGLFGAADLAIADLEVQLDIGDDGTIDETVQSNQFGDYEFLSLPQGLYRVIANLPTGFSRTTPTSLLIDMDTAEAVQLPAIGGSDDTDRDGVSNADEINSLAGIDGNGDGIADWLQSNVVSAESPDAGPITFVGPIGTTVRNVQFGAPRTDPPAGGAFPYGAIQFEIEGLINGGKANVDLLLHDNPSIAVVFTYGQTTSNPFDELYRSIGHSVDGDRVSVQLHDGSRSDLDDIANGRVTEEFLLSDANLAWQNPSDRFDVNNSGGVSTADALVIINQLRQRNPNLPPVNDEVDRFYDVNGDGRVTAADALQVINEVARRRSEQNNEQLDRRAASDQAIVAMMSDDADKETDDQTYTEESRIF